MTAEVRYSRFFETGRYVEKITFEEFVSCTISKLLLKLPFNMGIVSITNVQRNCMSSLRMLHPFTKFSD